MRIDWDQRKNAANRKKHGLSFEEASELFTSGADFLEIYDEAHSEVEDRFICIGAIRLGVIVVVTAEPKEEVLRIISARAATASEAALWSRHLKGKVHED